MQREQSQEQKEGVDSFMSPSFSTYSSDKLAHIADQVARDHFRSLNNSDFDDGHCQNDTDFEFVTFRKAADGVFLDGYAGPVFPIFNRDLLTESENARNPSAAAEEDEDVMALQFPMGKLLIGEEDRQSSSSSSEADDLDGIPAGTYCVWTPNPVQASPSRCKKSNSTGSSSSKRWKLLDLLRRSNSDGKESFVFLTPSSTTSSGSNSAKKKRVKAESSEEQLAGKKGPGPAGGGEKKGSGHAGGEKKVSAHEALYLRNRELRRMDKRRSYLPYRRDLVGFCASLSGMGRAFPHF